MGIRQNVYNESDNLYSSIITTKYYAELDKNSRWNHRHIEYNDAGIPILKLYIGETKKLFKDIYVNGIKSNLTFSKKLELKSNNDSTNESVCEIIGNSDENWITIHATKIGTYIITPEITGMLDSSISEHINDTDVMVIVEEEPTIVNLKWGHENPLVLTTLDELKLSIVAIYNNGQEYELNKNVIEKLKIIASNSLILDVIKCSDDEGFLHYNIKPYEYDERCQLKIKDNSILENFGNKFENIEPLMIVITKNISSKTLLEAKFKLNYKKEIPLLDVSNTHTILIYTNYELSTGEIIEHEVQNRYIFTSMNNNVAVIDNNLITPKMIGDTQIIAINENVDEEFSDIPKTITWDVKVIKTLTSIEWSIDTVELFIEKNQGTITVIAHYTDGSVENISNSCSFEYDSNFIKIEGDKIIPLAPGSTDISILSSFDSNVIVSDKKYNIIIVQPIENIDIVDIEKIVLDETELTLYVGDEKDLNYVIYPENATPQTLVWHSTDENVVTVNNDGIIKVLKEGYAKIYVGVKANEVEISEEDRMEEDIPSLYSSLYATCSISAHIIDVTKISVSRNELTLYVGDEDYYFETTITPNNASNKNVTWSFESNRREWPIAIADDLSVKPIMEGVGILKLISVSNPEITTEIKITVIDNRVKKVKINPGNDDDYEFYDDFVKSPEVDLYKNTDDSKIFNDGSVYIISKIRNNERWDDDDFPRYYCPINNSLQLSATIEPSGANHSSLTWYSSDGTLVRCTETGIITPIRLGSETLDMYAEDDKNDEGRRFPNTTWITAYNQKSSKSGVCQVRVTRNNITGFIIGEPIEHDYDEDIFDENGNIKDSIINDNYKMQPPIEYERDYVLWRGEKKILPVTLSVQDPNFGPSNNFEWKGGTSFGGANWYDIVELSNDKVNHSNISHNFDWTKNSPEDVNNRKKNLNVEMNAIGLGSIYFRAVCEDKYWLSHDVYEGYTDDTGYVSLNTYDINIQYYGKLIDSDNETILEENGNPIIIRGWQIEYARVVLNNSNQLFVQIPTMIIDGVEAYVDTVHMDDCRQIVVTVYNNGTNVQNMEVFISAYSKVNTSITMLDRTNSEGVASCPSLTSTICNNFELDLVTDLNRPGNGEWKSVQNSRQLKVTVVDAPKNIYVCVKSFNRVATKGLPQVTFGSNIESVWPPNERLKIKYDNERCVPLFIRFEDEFIDLLNEYADGDICPLDDKYMSFAWFTSDPNVFIPVEISQFSNDKDKPIITEDFSGLDTSQNTRRKIMYNLKGYGRLMGIKCEGTGKAKLTIVNIMSGQSWERLIEII